MFIEKIAVKVGRAIENGEGSTGGVDKKIQLYYS
jgi:hypothetical protein